MNKNMIRTYLLTGLLSLTAIVGQAQNRYGIKATYNMRTKQTQMELVAKQKIGPLIVVHNSRLSGNNYLYRTALVLPLKKYVKKDGSSFQVQLKSVTQGINKPWTFTGLGGQFMFKDGKFSLTGAIQPLILTKKGRANYSLIDGHVAYKLPKGYSLDAMGIMKSQNGKFTGLESKVSVNKSVKLGKKLGVEVGVDGIYRVKKLDPHASEKFDVRATITMYLL